MNYLVCLAGTFAMTIVSALPASAEITGAGSTLAFPVLTQWAQAYQRSQSDAETQSIGAALDYEPVGSQAGVMRVRASAVDFGATDAPLSPDELEKYSLGQFPIVVGGIVVATSVALVAPGQMRLSGELIADIYLGKVTRWSDPAIKVLNPGLILPDAAITVLRRTDGSGTTFNFTQFLNKSSTDWRSRVGTGLSVAWPVGVGAKGNNGIAETLQRIPNAIGYVDFAQASRTGLSYTLVRNNAGAFVRPSTDTFRAAAESAGLSANADFDVSLTDTKSEAAYPIVAVTYAVVHRAPTPRGGRAAIEFFRWALDNGAQAASDLGYVPLPPSLVARVKQHWAAKF